MNDVWGEKLLLRLARQALADAWDLDRVETPTLKQWVAKASARLRTKLAALYPNVQLEDWKIRNWLLGAFAQKIKE